MLALKVAGALVLLVGLIWVLIVQPSQPLLRRIGLALIGLVMVAGLFVFVVSIRCDLGWLPTDECS